MASGNIYDRNTHLRAAYQEVAMVYFDISALKLLPVNWGRVSPMELYPNRNQVNTDAPRHLKGEEADEVWLSISSLYMRRPQTADNSMAATVAA